MARSLPVLADAEAARARLGSLLGFFALDFPAAVGLALAEQARREQGLQAVRADHDADLVDARRDLLERLELLQTQEHGLLGHHVRRVGQRSRGGRLLATQDD